MKRQSTGKAYKAHSSMRGKSATNPEKRKDSVAKVEELGRASSCADLIPPVEMSFSSTESQPAGPHTVLLPAQTAQDARSANGEAGTSAQEKERRGRRLKTFEGVRRGLSAVVNGIELGTMDPKRGAVLVQAYHELLNTLGTMEAVEVHRRAAELERLANGSDVGHA